jgi:hypothetical protein
MVRVIPLFFYHRTLFFLATSSLFVSTSWTLLWY